MNHSEHYPTFIENPNTGERALVKTPYDHHRKLLGWRLDGLDPEPAPPANAATTAAAAFDPEYPKFIEHPKSGQRVLVKNRQAEKDQLEAWIAKKSQSTTRPVVPPLTPPAPPAQSAAAATVTAGKTGSGKTGGKAASGKAASKATQPPTVEELVAKNYPRSIAQRMADEEIRKYNAGEAPYNQE